MIARMTGNVILLVDLHWDCISVSTSTFIRVITSKVFTKIKKEGEYDVLAFINIIQLNYGQ